MITAERGMLTSMVVVLLMACSSAVPESTNGSNTDSGQLGDVATLEQPLHGTTVLFYNVENLFDTKDDPSTNDQDFLPNSEMAWTEDRYRTKLEHLAEAIAMTDADLPEFLGLAEVENGTVVKDLADEQVLAKAKYAVVHFDSPDERGIDVALLYKRDKFTLENSESLHVDLGDDRTRDILHVELSQAGHTYHVFVNHWPSRSGGPEQSEPKRMAAAMVLSSAVEKINSGPKAHIIIMGDLNDTPQNNSIQKGLGATCGIGSAALVDLMCMDQPVGSGSYNYQGEWSFLDQFIVDPLTAKEVKKASAFSDERIMFYHPKNGPSPDKTYSSGHYKGGYSDHLPIVMRFR